MKEFEMKFTEKEIQQIYICLNIYQTILFPEERMPRVENLMDRFWDAYEKIRKEV